MLSPSSPSLTSAADELKPSLLERLAALRFFTFSFMAHVTLLILVGGVVVVQNREPAPDFAPEGSFVGPENDVQVPPRTEQLPDPSTFQPTTPVAAPSSIDAVNSISTLPTSFQVQSAPAVGLKMGELASSGALAGAATKLSSAGLSGGMAGGQGFFGTRDMGKKNLGLAGTFYDAKQTRSRKPTDMDVNQFSELIRKFVGEGWRESVLREFYQAPKRLYTTQIFMPNMPADEGPKAFDVDNEVKPSRWLVHYEGKVSPDKTGEYRFVGAGDDYLVVRVNGKLVLDHGFAKATDWHADKYYDYGWTKVPKGFARGDKFRVTAGQTYDLDILISERPGGLVFFCLLLEDQGVKYSQDEKGNPILPIFRLAKQPIPELEKNQTLPPYDSAGPIWQSVSK